MQTTATAHLDWDNRWKTDEGRADWIKPDASVVAATELAKARGGRKVLDLGCGVGRHALYLAEAGFDVCAIDASETGIAHCRTEAERLGLEVDAQVAMMNELPFENHSFDFVVSFNVIYHGDPEIVAGTAREVGRILKPKGLFQGTLLSKRNMAFGIGEEIAPDTFIDQNAADDKTHPHFYCDAKGVVELLKGFELMQLVDNEHKQSGHWHWHFLAEKL